MKVAITDLFPESWHPHVEAAVPAGWEYELAPEQSLETRSRMVLDADAVFCGSATPTPEMIAAASRLRFVQKLGAGFDNLDVELCKKKGIAVARLQGNNAVAVAEHAVMLMLAVYRGVLASDRRARTGGWGKDVARGRNREIRGKTVGIVGFGQIGRAVARRIVGFEASVVYHDVRRAPELETELGAEPVELDDLFRRSDIVTLHVPAFPETRGLVTRERLALMRPGGVLINCGRGDLVDEPALLDALRGGHLFGAGLDCFAKEGPGGSEAFWELENVVLSPHVAGVSNENFETMMSRAFANARRYLAGEGLPETDVVWMPPATARR